MLGLSQRQTGCLVWFKTIPGGGLTSTQHTGSSGGQPPTWHWAQKPCTGCTLRSRSHTQVLATKATSRDRSGQSQEAGLCCPTPPGLRSPWFTRWRNTGLTQPGPGRCPGPRCQRQPFPEAEPHCGAAPGSCSLPCCRLPCSISRDPPPGRTPGIQTTPGTVRPPLPGQARWEGGSRRGTSGRHPAPKEAWGRDW